MHLLLLKDTDINSPKPILHILKKEIHAVKKAMELIGVNHLVLSHFDAHGGDCGCQFRASIMAELISHLTPSSIRYFERRLKEVERIEAQIEHLSKKPELFFHYPKQAMKKEHHHQKITLTHVLKFYS